MACELSIHYNTNKSGRNIGAYKVWLRSSSEEASPLRQIGPVWNGIVSYSGTFGTRKEAIEAALDYIAVPCRLVEFTDVLSGITSVTALPVRAPAPFQTGYTARVIGSNLPSGRFVAAE